MSTRRPRCAAQLAQQPHALRAVGHGALEVRDAADHVDALVERALQVVAARPASAARRPAETRRAAGRGRARRARLHLEQRVDRQQPRVADVDVRADREQALAPPPSRSRSARARRSPPAVSSGFSSPHSAMPSSSVPLCVDARQAVRQRRVHVEVRVDERRRDELAGSVDASSRARRRRCRRATSTMRPSCDRDVDAGRGRRAAWRCVMSRSSIVASIIARLCGRASSAPADTPRCAPPARAPGSTAAYGSIR